MQTLMVWVDLGYAANLTPLPNRRLSKIEQVVHGRIDSTASHNGEASASSAAHSRIPTPDKADCQKTTVSSVHN